MKDLRELQKGEYYIVSRKFHPKASRQEQKDQSAAYDAIVKAHGLEREVRTRSRARAEQAYSLLKEAGADVDMCIGVNLSFW